jgi:hypothetical protein
LEVDDEFARRFARGIIGLFGLVFLVGVIAGAMRGAILLPLVMAIFATGAFSMRWLIGKGVWDWP